MATLAPEVLFAAYPAGAKLGQRTKLCTVLGFSGFVYHACKIYVVIAVLLSDNVEEQRSISNVCIQNNIHTEKKRKFRVGRKGRLKVSLPSNVRC